ncbi:hypothetical protein D3C77_799900 [compost metagenome]
MVTCTSNPTPHTLAEYSRPSSLRMRMKVGRPVNSRKVAYTVAAPSIVTASQRLGYSPASPATKYGVAV